MADHIKSLTAIFMVVLVIGGIIFGSSVFMFTKDMIGYNSRELSGYNYDFVGDYLTEHEEIVLSRMNTGLAMMCGAGYGIYFLNSDKKRG